jgi:hypothetical protein
LCAQPVIRVDSGGGPCTLSRPSGKLDHKIFQVAPDVAPNMVELLERCGELREVPDFIGSPGWMRIGP